MYFKVLIIVFALVLIPLLNIWVPASLFWIALVLIMSQGREISYFLVVMIIVLFMSFQTGVAFWSLSAYVFGYYLINNSNQRRSNSYLSLLGVVYSFLGIIFFINNYLISIGLLLLGWLVIFFINKIFYLRSESLFVKSTL